eukprot:scaffold32084_cov51-Phaeocystis_antarctica.AAC.2
MRSAVATMRAASSPDSTSRSTKAPGGACHIGLKVEVAPPGGRTRRIGAAACAAAAREAFSRCRPSSPACTVATSARSALSASASSTNPEPTSSGRTPSVASSVLILPLDVRSFRYLASSGWAIRLSSTLTRTETAASKSASPTSLSISRPAACSVVSAVAELDSCSSSGRAKVAPPRSLCNANSRAFVCASVSTSTSRFSCMRAPAARASSFARGV